MALKTVFASLCSAKLNEPWMCEALLRSSLYPLINMINTKPSLGSDLQTEINRILRKLVK